MKKALAILLAALMCMTLLAACTESGSTQSSTQSSNTSSSTTEPKAEPTTLTVMCHTSWKTPAAEASFNYVAEKLNIKWEWTLCPEGSEGEEMIFTKIGSGDVPDILFWQSAQAVAEKMGADTFEEMDGDYMKWYDADSLQNAQYVDPISGKRLVVPYGDTNVIGWIYNKTAFKNAGIDNLPKTWSDFLAVCEKIKATGVTPVYFAGQDSWTLQLPAINTWGVIAKFEPTFDEEMAANTKHWVDSQYLLDTYKGIVELKDKGYLNDNMMSADYASAQHAVVDGTAAMYMMPTAWFDAELQGWGATREQQENLSIMPINFTDDTSKLLGVAFLPAGFALPTAAPNKDLAREAITMLVSPESLQARYNVAPGIPFILASTGVKPGEAIGYVKGAYDNIMAPGLMGVYGAFPSKFIYGPGNLPAEMQEMLMGNVTPLEVLQHADDDTKKAALEKGDPNWK